MRFAALTLGMCVVVGLATVGRTADEADSNTKTIDLWPGAAPGEVFRRRKVGIADAGFGDMSRTSSALGRASETSRGMRSCNKSSLARIIGSR